MDLFDWLDRMHLEGRTPECPTCHETDVKFAVHSREVVGVDVSVRCNDCRREDSGLLAGVEALVRRWHAWPKHPPQGDKHGSHG